MRVTGRIISYSLIILILGILLKVTGILHTNTSVLFAFALILSGAGIFTNYFGSQSPKLLFSAASIFFLGFIIILVSFFSVDIGGRFYTPVILLVAGINFLLLFFDDMKRKMYLLLFAVLGGVGFIILAYHGGMSFHSFFMGIWDIIRSFWLFLLLLLVIILSIVFRDK